MTVFDELERIGEEGVMASFQGTGTDFVWRD
jgi:hypothetical protein